MMMKLPVSLLAVGLVCSTGCYRYVPVGIEAVSPGQSVRALLSSDAADQLSESVREGRSVAGEFVAQDAGGLMLSVPSTVRREGFFAEDLHERIILRPADVMNLEKRELDRTRTYIAAGAGAAGVIAIAVWTLTGKTGGNTRSGTDLDTSAGVVSLFRLSFP